MFKELGKAVFGTLLLPVDIVRDTVTMGGVLEDKDESNTVTRLKKIGKNLERADGD